MSGVGVGSYWRVGSSSPPCIMTPIVKLSMPGVLFLFGFFFLSFLNLFIFFTSGVIVDRTFGVSEPECYCEGCWSSSVELHSWVFHLCPSVFHFVHFSYLVLWFSFVYLFWSSTTLKHVFNVICSFLSWPMPRLVCPQFYSVLCSLFTTTTTTPLSPSLPPSLSLSLSDLFFFFSNISFFPSCLISWLLSAQEVLSWSWQLILLFLLSWFYWNYRLSHHP